MLHRVFGVSQRRACRLVGQHRSTQRKPPAAEGPSDPDAGLRAWLRDWAKDHPRWGYRRAYHAARNEGWVVNHKKLQRLWRDEGLRVPVKRRRKRAGTSTAPQQRSQAPNQIWGIDFQFDATDDGRPVKILHVIDEYTREILGGIAAQSITGADLAAHLDQITNLRGTAPTVLRLDNGPEMISTALAD